MAHLYWHGGGSRCVCVWFYELRKENAKMTFEEAVLSVWREALVEKLKTVTIGEEIFPVRSTAKKKLRQIDFRFDGRELRGLEQNPDTKSRWAAMARKGQQVMQILEGGRYVAVVADGKVRSYVGKTQVEWTPKT